MMPTSVLNDAARLGLAILLNSLWQGVVIAFVAWAALRIFARANAATRYAIWSLALFAMLVIPVLTSVSRVTVEQQPAHVKVIVAAPPSQHIPALPPLPHSTVVADRPSVTNAMQAFTAPHLRFPTALAVAVFAIWGLAALFVLARLIYAIVWLERLKRDSLPLDVAYRDQMPEWNKALKDFRDVRLCVSDTIEVPVAIGLFDALILLPNHLVQSLEPEEIDQIALHELGHLRRNDDWTNALQRVACSLLFFSPAAWFVSRQLDIEREVACDDYVLQATGAARSYAFCLTRIAEVTSWPYRGVAAPGVFITRRNISIRIERLLRSGRTIGSSIAPEIAASALAALILVSILVRTMTPSVAYTLPATKSGPEAAKAVVKVVDRQPAPKPPHIVHVRSSQAQQKVTDAGTTVGTAVGSTVGSIVGATVGAAVDTSVGTALKIAQGHAEQLKMQAQQKAERERQVAEAVSMSKAIGGISVGDICTNCDFRNANLNGHDFSNQKLTGADFHGAKLRGAHFENAQLTGVDFAHADLRDASFANANLIGCNLTHAQLGRTRFDGARLVGCDFDTQSLSPQQTRIFLMSCVGCNFENADLHGMDLRNVHLKGSNLDHANLSGADLSGATFSGVNFDGANFSGAKIDRAHFIGSNLNDVDFSNVDLSAATFTGSSLSRRAR